MRKIYILIIIILFGSFVGTNTIFAQSSSEDIEVTRYNYKNRPVYWFYITLKIVQDKTTGEKIYNVRRINNLVESGKRSEYERDLWQGMGVGMKIAIGPFTNRQQALEAIELYDMATVRKDHAKILEKTDDVFWFMVKVSITQRAKSYEFERVPARVASGTMKEFEDALWEGIYTRNLFIGPFVSLEDAEEAKRVYRLEE